MNKKLTKDQITAVLFCQKAELDPTQYIAYQDPDGFAVLRRAERFRVLADEAKRLRCWVEAINETSGMEIMTTIHEISQDIERLRNHRAVEADVAGVTYYSTDANREIDPYVARLVRLRDLRKQLADLRKVYRIRMQENLELSDEITSLQLQLDRECANEAGY